MRGKKKMKRNMKIKKGKISQMFSSIQYVVFVVLPVMAIVLLLFYAYTNIHAVFPIREVVFEGNKHLTDEELMQLAGLKKNESLLTLSSRKIHERMMQSPWIRSVRIRKEFPHTLTILIRESEPFALIDIKGHLFMIDERGKMLQELKDSRIPFLPVISGTPFGKTKVISEALELVRAIRERGLLFEKDHIEIIAPTAKEMTVNLDGIMAKVGTGNYEDKLLRLIDLEEEIKRRNIHIDYIDLRFAKRAVVKPVKEVIR